MPLESDLLEPESVFHGRYRIVRCLKSGGMGAVYEVIQLQTKRRRALKTMLPSLVDDADLRARFHQEATVAAEVESEHIVEVIDAGVDTATGLPFLVMDYLKGQNLAEVLKSLGSLPATEVLTLLYQMSLALDRTHVLDIVHRDLKPENVLLTRRDDGSPHIKLLDFGIAKLTVQRTGAGTTRSFGTPLYMSPEQIRGDGDIGPRADLYALAQLAFTLLIGHPYWQPESEAPGGVYSLLVKVMEGAPEPPSARAARYGATLPPAFDEWFLRATAVEPAQRFDCASELVAALAQAFGIALPSQARPNLLFAPAKDANVTVASPTPRPTPTALPAQDTVSAITSSLPHRGASRPRLWLALGGIGAALLLLLAASRSSNPTLEPGSVAAPEVEPPVAPLPTVPSQDPSATTEKAIKPTNAVSESITSPSPRSQPAHRRPIASPLPKPASIPVSKQKPQRSTPKTATPSTAPPPSHPPATGDPTDIR